MAENRWSTNSFSGQGSFGARGPSPIGMRTMQQQQQRFSQQISPRVSVVQPTNLMRAGPFPAAFPSTQSRFVGAPARPTGVRVMRPSPQQQRPRTTTPIDAQRVKQLEDQKKKLKPAVAAGPKRVDAISPVVASKTPLQSRPAVTPVTNKPCTVSVTAPGKTTTPKSAQPIVLDSKNSSDLNQLETNNQNGNGDQTVSQLTTIRQPTRGKVVEKKDSSTSLVRKRSLDEMKEGLLLLKEKKMRLEIEKLEMEKEKLSLEMARLREPSKVLDTSSISGMCDQALGQGEGNGEAEQEGEGQQAEGDEESEEQ